MPYISFPGRSVQSNTGSINFWGFEIQGNSTPTISRQFNTFNSRQLKKSIQDHFNDICAFNVNTIFWVFSSLGIFKSLNFLYLFDQEQNDADHKEMVVA